MCSDRMQTVVCFLPDGMTHGTHEALPRAANGRIVDELEDFFFLVPNRYTWNILETAIFSAYQVTTLPTRNVFTSTVTI
jgi:hypothetical protein